MILLVGARGQRSCLLHLPHSIGTMGNVSSFRRPISRASWGSLLSYQRRWCWRAACQNGERAACSSFRLPSLSKSCESSVEEYSGDRGLLNFYVNVQIDRRRPKHILCLAYTPPRSQQLRPKISPRDSRDIPLGIYDKRLDHAIGSSLGRDGVEDIA